MSSLHLHQNSDQPLPGQLFDIFVQVFVEGKAAPVYMDTQPNIPLTTENAFRAQVQQMFKGEEVRKVTLTVLRSKTRELQEIPEWTLKPLHFQKGVIATVRSKGPSPDYPKVVEVNGVKHRLPTKRKKAKKKISRRVKTPGKKRRAKHTKQKRVTRTPKATRRTPTKVKRKSNKRK